MSNFATRTEAGYRSDPLLSGLPLLLVTPALFALNMLIARWAESAAIPPLFLAFGRWTLALLLILPLAARGLWLWRRVLWNNAGQLLALAATGMAITVGAQYVGARDTAAANVALIFAACPLLIAIMESLIWRTPIGNRRAWGMLLSVCGVLVVLSRGRSFGDFTIGEGDLWVLFAACAWSAYSILSRRRAANEVPGTVRLAALIAGGALMLAPFALAEAANGQIADFGDPRLYLALLALALVPSLGAYLCYDRLVRSVGSAGAGMSLYLVPLYTALAAWPLLGEVPQLFHGAGLGLILAGVVLSGLQSQGGKA